MATQHLPGPGPAVQGSSESGFLLIEVVISAFVLSVAVAALLAVLAAGALSLQRAGKEGTALTLADKQLEVYRGLSYASARLYAPDIPTGTDPYVTANSSDVTIPSSTGEVVGGANGEPACTTSGSPAHANTPECMPTQTVTGPDHRQYRVDTYITYLNPVGGSTTGRQEKQIMVIVRDATASGLAILARNASTFDQSTYATG